MLYQIHWQDRDDLKKTEFVAQGEIKDEDSFLKTWAFFQEAMIRSLQNGNRPGDNWVPLMIDENHENFLRVASPTGTSNESTGVSSSQGTVGEGQAGTGKD